MMDAERGINNRPVVELRRYRLHPGCRETLIELFDREFVETQEAAGIQVLGQYRDIDDPDAFMWLRAFADMPSRAEALGRFYDGPVWARHRDAANATMVNSDNVLLLRPTSGGEAFDPSMMRGIEGDQASSSLFLCVTHALAPGTADEFARFFEASMRTELERASATIIATMTTELDVNTFPRLPVRSGETVFVWLAWFADTASYAIHVGQLAQSEVWTRAVLPEIASRTWRTAEIARLVPTARSHLR